ncbi:MAG: hypothetical protein CM1200mP34_2170 [Verrucomicrobiales bacterium]|nr:MAG: hypothetical protein CM1200mP34_2170 [Verrucomicrobiales bacterium]
MVDGNVDAFKQEIAKAGKLSNERKSQLPLRIDDKKEAKNSPLGRPSRGSGAAIGQPCRHLWRNGKEKEAIEQLRNSAHFPRTSISSALSFSGWPPSPKKSASGRLAVAFQPADDIGDRPSLDTWAHFAGLLRPHPAGN